MDMIIELPIFGNCEIFTIFLLVPSSLVKYPLQLFLAIIYVIFFISYRRLLRLARTQNFLRFDATKAIYVSGIDVNGNRVVSVVGRYIPANELDLEKVFCLLDCANSSKTRYSCFLVKVMLYVIYTMDSVVDSPYMIVYFNTMTTQSNHFSSDFLRKLYNTLDHRYKVNLARLCIVHTTVRKKVH